MNIKVYNYYNEEYGIRIRLTLNKIKKELTYQCTEIKDEYRGKFMYKCKNGWKITSGDYHLQIDYDHKMLYLCSGTKEYDNCMITVRNNRFYYECEDSFHPFSKEYTKEHGGFHYNRPFFKIYKDIKQVYNELAEALNELGNDLNIDKAFLNM